MVQKNCSGINVQSEYTRGDQKVLQSDYKTVIQQITHTVIFHYILLQRQCIFSILLLHCLHVEKRFFPVSYTHLTLPTKRIV